MPHSKIKILTCENYSCRFHVGDKYCTLEEIEILPSGRCIHNIPNDIELKPEKELVRYEY